MASLTVSIVYNIFASKDIYLFKSAAVFYIMRTYKYFVHAKKRRILHYHPHLILFVIYEEDTFSSKLNGSQLAFPLPIQDTVIYIGRQCHTWTVKNAGQLFIFLPSNWNLYK
jgi:hypothetical protein